MTVSAIAVTEGSGKNIWTDQRTVSAVVRQAQYVLLAEPAGATYSVVAEDVSIANAGDHVLQIMAGASLYVRVYRIVIKQAANTTAANAAGRTLEIRRLSTAGTGGTVITPRPFDGGDAAAGATAMQGILNANHGTEGDKLLRTYLVFRQAILATGAQADDIWSWEAHPRGKPIIIAPGVTNGIGIVNITATAGATVNVTVEFTETSYL